MFMRKLLLPAFCGLAILAALEANAGILINEDFSHTNGNLVGQTPTPGPGTAWAAHSGAGNKPVQVSSGEISLEQSSGSGEDVSTAFNTAQSATDTTYARFDFSLPSSTNSGIGTLDSDGLYFAHFKNSAFFFQSRVGVLPPTSGGDFILALSTDSSNMSSGASWPNELSFDTTYQVVTSFNAATGEGKLWLDPVNEASDSLSDIGNFTGDEVAAYAFRQASDYTGEQIADNLVVATTFNEALTGIPEPTSIVLLFAGLLGIATMRRG